MWFLTVAKKEVGNNAITGNRVKILLALALNQIEWQKIVIKRLPKWDNCLYSKMLQTPYTPQQSPKILQLAISFQSTLNLFQFCINASLSMEKVSLFSTLLYLFRTGFFHSPCSQWSNESLKTSRKECPRSDDWALSIVRNESTALKKRFWNDNRIGITRNQSN